MRKPLLILLFSLRVTAAFCQAELNSKTIEIFCDTLIHRGMKEKLVPGFAISLVYRDSVLLKKGYGFSSIEDQIPVSAESTLFELGSVGKVFTAIAVLQQVQSGNLDLQRDVNTYLKDFKIEDPYKTPVTLFSLLTHTAGFDDRVFGYMARNNAGVKPLGQHLKERMPQLFMEPGKQINYSNYSYALAGYIVELVSGQSFADYIRHHIFEPLGMTETTYFLPGDSDRKAPYANGYQVKDKYVKTVSYPRHALPAGSIISSASDMTLFIRELLHPAGKLLNEDMHRMLVTRQFSDHPLLMGYSMGLEEQLINGEHGFAKGGMVPGFLSALYVLPSRDLALFVVTNTQTDNFMEQFSSSFFTTFFPGSVQYSKLAKTNINTKTYAGVYRDSRYNHHSIEDLPALYQGKFDIYKKGDSALTCFHNDAWQVYKPENDSVFFNVARPYERLIFTLDSKGEVTGLSRNMKLGAFYVPTTLERVPWYDNPVMINEYYFFTLLFIFTFIFVWLFRVWVMIRRKKNSLYYKNKLISPIATLIMSMIVVGYLAQLLGGIFYMVKNINDFFIFLPGTFRYVQYITYLFPALAIGVLWCAKQEWQKKLLPVRTKIYYSLLAICTVIHFLFLWRWHFIGINY